MATRLSTLDNLLKRIHWIPSHNRTEDDEPSEQTPLIPPPPAPGPSDAPNSAPKNNPPGAATSDGHTSPNQTLTWVRGTLCTIALGALIFLQATNISLLTTTQSSIASSLDAFEKTTWFTSAYLIAVSSLGPLNGKLATVFGPRICIFSSTVVLAVGSMVSSVANSFAVFIVGRSITGVGASGILTISIIVVLELSGSKRRGLAIGMLNSGFTVGVAVGATAAGALLPRVGWRALFWMQAPIALTGGTILLLAIPHDFHAGKNPNDEDDETSSHHTAWKRLRQLDYLGALTLTASIVLLLFALSSPKEVPIFPIILSGLVLAVFILNEIHLATDPIIPVPLLKSRGLLLTCLGTVGYMMARWCVLFYTPTYALAVRQWSPATAGSILIPTNGGFAIGGLVVGWLHIRRHGSFYIPTVVVYALFPLTLVLLSTLCTQHSSPALFVLVVFACGAVTGAALNYNLAHLLHLTPPHTHYIATSLVATFRGFAGSFGSSIGGGLFTRKLHTSLTEGFEREGLRHREELVRRLLGSPALVENLGGKDREVAIAGYQDALRALFLAAAALAMVMVFVQAGTGWKAPVAVMEDGGGGASRSTELDEERRVREGYRDRRDEDLE